VKVQAPQRGTEPSRRPQPGPHRCGQPVHPRARKIVPTSPRGRRAERDPARTRGPSVGRPRRPRGHGVRRAVGWPNRRGPGGRRSRRPLRTPRIRCRAADRPRPGPVAVRLEGRVLVPRRGRIALRRRPLIRRKRPSALRGATFDAAAWAAMQGLRRVRRDPEPKIQRSGGQRNGSVDPLTTCEVEGCMCCRDTMRPRHRVDAGRRSPAPGHLDALAARHQPWIRDRDLDDLRLYPEQTPRIPRAGAEEDCARAGPQQ